MRLRRVLLLPALLLVLSGCGGGPDEGTARASCAISVRLNGFDPDNLVRFDYGDGGHEYKLRGVTMCYATPDSDEDGWEVEYVGPR